ncbi:hypothetical protein [Nonomuraea endophytica]|uniref:Uncharacterized protein n=1 Tax=Nonomuraea endophytica TaxID=714136 RepID=A0A7W8EFP1_9ACTN|nr:hypothetical protein [Nonomuraea endophytica]MBB5078985.1 hypothetical protein [Nonomuraea endophytica]
MPADPYDVARALREGLGLGEGAEPDYPVRPRALAGLWLALAVLLLLVGAVVAGYAGVVA